MFEMCKQKTWKSTIKLDVTHTMRIALLRLFSNKKLRLAVLAEMGIRWIQAFKQRYILLWNYFTFNQMKKSFLCPFYFLYLFFIKNSFWSFSAHWAIISYCVFHFFLTNHLKSSFNSVHFSKNADRFFPILSPIRQNNIKIVETASQKKLVYKYDVQSNIEQVPHFIKFQHVNSI